MNGEKRSAILQATGHCLVLGGPGSGKTTLALEKAESVLDQLQPGQRVLFLSFSRAAVARILEASRKIIRSGLKSSFSIQTFHSFCWEILQTHGYLLGAPRHLSILLPHDEKALNGGIKQDHQDWPAWEQERLRLFQERGAVSFDLFAPLVARLLRESRRISARICSCYPLLLVDEAQDTGPDQWACARELANFSQMICLADLDQLIYDYLPGIGPERVDQIREELHPLEVDLEGENNRSPGTEILAFARDVLNMRIKTGTYPGVSRLGFNPRAIHRDRLIWQSLGHMRTKIQSRTGEKPKSIAFLAPNGRGVALISSVLRQHKVPHQVLFDDAFVMLACRFAAFLLEPKNPANLTADVVLSLNLLSAAYKSTGVASNLKKATTFIAWAEKLRSGKRPRAGLVDALEAVLRDLASIPSPLNGDPRQDWNLIKRLLTASRQPDLLQVADGVDYLVAFNRADRITSNLSALWVKSGSYTEARAALDQALTEEIIFSALDSEKGIHVMNMHKCKGKEFDGVIVFRDGHNSSLVWRDDPHPHPKSRKLLFVAVTRSRKHVLLLEDASAPCPITGPYKL